MSQTNSLQNYVITIDSRQFEIAIEKSKILFKNVLTFLSNKQNSNEILIIPGQYYFSLLNKTTKSGLQVCISPKNHNLEIYIVNNSKKNPVNINSNAMITNADQLMNYFYLSFVDSGNMTSKLETVYKSTKIFFSENYPNFEVTKLNTIIKIIETNTSNGYYIYFDKTSFALIGTVVNNQYFNTNSTSVFSESELVEAFGILINQNYHSVRYYNIIDTKYLGCDMTDYLDNSTSSIDNSIMTDPIDYS